MQKPDTESHVAAFKALADETRVKIVLLLNNKPRSVSEIVDFFSLSQPTISRHLLLLKQAGLVVAKRRGQQVIYTLAESQLRRQVLDFFSQFDCCRDLLKSAKKK